MRRRHPSFSAIAVALLTTMLLGSLPASPPAAAQGGQPSAAAPSLAAELAASPAPPAPDPTVTRLYAPVRSGLSGSAAPQIDARDLIAKWRAAGEPVNTPIFDEAALAQLAARAASASAGAPVDSTPNRDPASSTASTASLPAPDAPATSPAADAAPDTAAPAAGEPLVTPYRQSGLSQATIGQNCSQPLADPGNSYPTLSPPYWPVYEQIVYYSSLQYTSPPYSWYMAENELGVNDGATEDGDTTRDTRPGRDTDMDGFGQAFSAPADMVTLKVTLNFQYVAGTAVAGDRLYVELYQAGTSGGSTGYGDFIVGTNVDVGALDDGLWKTLTWTITSETSLAALRGRQLVLRVSTWNTNNGISTKVYIDDIAANVCQPTIVGGYVSRLGNGAASSGDMSDAMLLLMVNVGNDSLLLGLTLPRSDGLYAFGSLPALPAGNSYQIIYFNYSIDGSPLDDSRMSLLYGPATSGAVGASDVIGMPTFDIANVILGRPEPYATVQATPTQPQSFTWQVRSLPAGYPHEYYQQCIYDSQTVEPGTSDPVILCTEPLGDNPGENPAQSRIVAGNQPTGSFPSYYPFAYGRPYAWYVMSCTATVDTNGDGRGDWCAGQVGYSFYKHTITFVEQKTAPPSSPQQPGGTLPTTSASRPWTVMFYFGGDNNLGDRDRTPNPTSNLIDQFESLKKIAPRVTSAHVVALGDFYGNTGTQICYLSSPSGPQCQELGEQNSADPALLTAFVNQGLSYPADRTMLVITDHGHGITGISYDETATGGPSMTPSQVVEALSAAGLSSPTRKLDVLVFNACLMATAEIAVMMAPFADYLVASADQVWMVNFFERLFALLGGSPRAVAAGLVDAYSAALDALEPGVYRTMIALDLSKIGAVNTALSGLADALSANQTPAGKAEIAQARRAVQVYDSDGNNLLDQSLNNAGQVSNVEADAFVDIAHLASLLASSSNQAVRSAAASLATSLKANLVVKTILRGGSNGENARHDYAAGAIGLSLYFSNTDIIGDQATLNSLYLQGRNVKQFNDGSTWDNFLRSYVYGLVQGPGSIGRGPGSIGRGGRPISGRMVVNSGVRLSLPLIRR